MNNPEKLATFGIQDEDNQTKIPNTICVAQQYTQTSTK